MIRPDDPTALKTALYDPSPEVRGRATIALQRIGVLELRVEELGGRDRDTVERAHRTLVEMGRAGVIESLLGYLEHPTLAMRSRIAAIVGDLEDPHAIEALKPLLKDEQ